MTVGVLQLSDIHVTSSGYPAHAPDPERRLDTVLAAAAHRFGAPDLVVASGDLTDDASVAACARLADRTVVTSAFGEPFAAVGGWQVLGVDTSRPQQVHGTVDVAVERARFDALDERPTLVVLHHPPTSPSTHEWFQLDGGRELCAMLASHPEVRAILGGHLHQPFEAELDGVAVLGAPSTWVAITHEGGTLEVGGSDATGARWLELADDGTFLTTVLRA